QMRLLALFPMEEKLGLKEGLQRIASSQKDLLTIAEKMGRLDLIDLYLSATLADRSVQATKSAQKIIDQTFNKLLTQQSDENRYRLARALAKTLNQTLLYNKETESLPEARPLQLRNEDRTVEIALDLSPKQLTYAVHAITKAQERVRQVNQVLQTYAAYQLAKQLNIDINYSLAAEQIKRAASQLRIDKTMFTDVHNWVKEYAPRLKDLAHTLKAAEKQIVNVSFEEKIYPFAAEAFYSQPALPAY
ncbi:MAG: hypothetical protein C4321_04780, partial [Chloroflexota bacterium]